MNYYILHTAEYVHNGSLISFWLVLFNIAWDKNEETIIVWKKQPFPVGV